MHEQGPVIPSREFIVVAHWVYVLYRYEMKVMVVCYVLLPDYCILFANFFECSWPVE